MHGSLTKELQILSDKLLATVYAEDDEAFDLWRKIAGLSEDKIIRIATSDNFWSMGDTGPCGPCSEIFFDHGEGIAGGPPGSPDEDGDRFIEIWNLVSGNLSNRRMARALICPSRALIPAWGWNVSARCCRVSMIITTLI